MSFFPLISAILFFMLGTAVSSHFWWGLLLTGPPVLLGVYDIEQTRHRILILRNLILGPALLEFRDEH